MTFLWVLLLPFIYFFHLKYLCESQFDDNIKFKMAINEEDPEKMRLQPIGRDQRGLMYWLQLDQEQNIRLYTEEQDDTDGSTWKCIVRYQRCLTLSLHSHSFIHFVYTQ